MDMNVKAVSAAQTLYVETPLIESYALSSIARCKVYLKLENTQPSDSFKLRGTSNLIQKEVAKGCKRLVASSGGNAGLAAAYAVRKLCIPITVYVPSSTPQTMIDRIKGEEATVIVHGKVWNEANEKATQEARDPGNNSNVNPQCRVPDDQGFLLMIFSDCAFIHPYDHPDIWEGHSTMMDEIAAAIETRPDVVVASVGGGGLLNGIVLGMERAGWKDVPIVAMETVGAHCFNAAVKAGKVVTLPRITSVATTLGSLSVSEQTLVFMKDRKIISEVITDKECIDACVRFVDDERMLVEPSCGAALGAVYSEVLHRLRDSGELAKLETVVIIVCGGHAVTLSQLSAWKQEVGLS